MPYVSYDNGPFDREERMRERERRTDEQRRQLEADEIRANIADTIKALQDRITELERQG